VSDTYRGVPCVDVPFVPPNLRQRFVWLSGTGVLEEREPVPSYATQAEAEQAFEATFDAFAAGKAGVVHWRFPPQHREHEGRHQVAARLAILEVPVEC
jgi:hypothetical protein